MTKKSKVIMTKKYIYMTKLRFLYKYLFFYNKDKIKYKKYIYLIK